MTMTIDELYDKPKKDYGECRHCKIIRFPITTSELNLEEKA